MPVDPSRVLETVAGKAVGRPPMRIFLSAMAFCDEYWKEVCEGQENPGKSGQRGIRTPGRVTPSPVFKTGAFDQTQPSVLLSHLTQKRAILDEAKF